MVVFGGMASVWGAVVGAAVLTLLPQFLTVLEDYEMMVFGAVLIATMVFMPRGIVPTLARLALRAESADMSAAGSRTPGQGLRRRAGDRRPELRGGAGTVHSVIGPTAPARPRC
jgi:hypothetical protein